MRGLLQRVTHASVTIASDIVGEETVEQEMVGQDIVGQIGSGLVLFLGIQKGDLTIQADQLLHKLLHYRIFNDSDDKMNVSLLGINGGLLIVSQFTLAADTRKGRRPSFSTAASPALAESLYNYFVVQSNQQAADHGITIASGIFGANMQVALVNDGPVTFLLET